MDLPPTFVDLATAREQPENAFVNIIGVVVDLQAPTLAKSGQYMFTFKLLDRKLQGALVGEEGLSVRFFKPVADQLPGIRNSGDVVLLRAIKIITFSGVRMAIANFATEFQVFSGGKGIPAPNFSIAYTGKQRLTCSSASSPLAEQKLNLAEQEYIMQINQDMSRAVERVQESRKTRSIDEVSDAVEPPAKRQKAVLPTVASGIIVPTGPAALRQRPAPPGPSAADKKFKLISQLGDKVYADICVKVVKKSQENYGGDLGCDLYVTDYTENKLMRYYAPPEEDIDLQKDGDQFGYANHQPKKSLPGPYGHQILKVNVKQPHAKFARTSVNEGDFIVLRNMKARITTWSGNAFLEGDLWHDHDTPEQINIRPVRDMGQPVVKKLLARQETYDNKRQRLTELEGQIKETKTKLSKRAEKKAKKANNKALEAMKRGRAQHGLDDQGGQTVSKFDQNPHIRCSHEEIRSKHVKDILDPDNRRHTNTLPNSKGTYILPFINARYRTKVRVVDFFPKDLADFAVPVEPNSSADDYDSMSWQYSNGTPSHEWYFSLILEAASTAKARHNTKLEVHLQHEQAVFLLGNDMPDPEDLRQSPKLLAKLREKLFVLWGNLEEKRDDEELDNMPFECCIEEYGIEIDESDPEKAKRPEGWRRMYAMFGTTIL